MQRSQYLRRLQEAILAVHEANATHERSQAVTEIFPDETAWKGNVEVFSITGHPKARRCYAWAYDDKGTLRTTAVLELPPVDSPESAVRVAIAAKSR
ncbi:MAG: hypothetical protein JWQ44_2824 [Chthoniobacter sp.]|jgi:hypothetical protein|nr:hypothetical protein [Chthoniobacter sp.]